MNILEEETESIRSYLQTKDENWPNLSLACKSKNAEDCVKYRNKANEIFNSKNHHTEYIHEKVLALFSKSVAFALLNTEDLAISFENRSSLLFHLKRFEECIVDCDRGLGMTTSNNLKAKLLCRKAECLFLLKDLSVKKLCNEALFIIEKMLLANSIKKSYRQKLKDIMAKKIKPEFQNPAENLFNSSDSAIKFPCQEEVSCASESVSIEYNKEWGRHITATKKIKPGEIISVEKNFNTQCCLDGQYLFCSNCFKSVYASIPCDNCAFHVYCSKKCQENAINYHKFECLISQFLWYIDNEHKLSLSLKFFLKAVKSAGGLEKIKACLEDIENCKDPRTKGFTNGVFKTEDAKSFLSLSSKVKLSDHAKKIFVERSCYVIFLLGQHTSFFKNKMILSKSDFMNDGEVLLATALFLNVMLKLQCYSYLLQSRTQNDSDEIKIKPVKTYGMSIGVFSGLINHSCDPNVGRFVTKDNNTVVYAKQLIKKGSQLFLSYFGEEVDHQFLALSNRRSNLLRNYGFVCTCAACKEDWPCYKNSLNRLIQTNPEKFEVVLEELKAIESSLQNAFGVWKFEIPKYCYNS